VLRLAQEAGGFGTFEWDIGSGTLTASRTFKRLYGFGEGIGAIPVAVFRERVHPEDRDKIATSSGRSLEESLRYAEYRIIGDDGSYRWVGRQGTVINDADGRPSKVVGAVHDITQRKQFEARLETVAQESAHRVKNLLAIVQAIVSQTLRRAGDIAALAGQQRAILTSLWPLLKSGGRLLYATCSVFPEENEGQIDAFLVRQPTARRLVEERLLPREEHDGFYYALLRKAP